MTCTAKEYAKVAHSQIGVKESPKNSNNVKYNTAFYGHSVYGSNYAWCFVYLWWCAQKAGIKFPHNANAAYGQDELVSRCGAKWIMKKNTSRATRKAYLKKAKKGDIVCFDFGYFDAYRRHVGTVYSVQGDYIWCLEGNTSADSRGSQSNGGMVCLKKRHYTAICSAVRPPYAAPTTKKKATKTTTTKKTTTKKETTTKKTKTEPVLIAWNIGHSKTDSGAVSKYGRERDFCVKVSNYAISYLINNYNCKVISNDPTEKLEHFIDRANKAKAKLYVSVHFNSGRGDGWEGLLYKLDDAHKKCGKVFEKHVKAIGQNSRGLKARPDLKNLSKTDMMAILNECAFMDKWEDIKDWNEDKEFKAMGEALAKAAVEYLGVPKRN